MARIRTIKPEFWTDEKLSECSLSARLLFIGLWSFADDEGRLSYNPRRIQLQIFPCGTVSLEQVSAWLAELLNQKIVRLYAVYEKQYLDIPGFCKHQKINRPTPSRLPEFSPTTQTQLTEYSVTPICGTGTGTGTGTGKKTNTQCIQPASSPADITPPSTAAPKPTAKINGAKKFIRPTLADIREHIERIGAAVDPVQFFNYYESINWRVGRNPMANWKAAIMTWQRKAGT